MKRVAWTYSLFLIFTPCSIHQVWKFPSSASHWNWSDSHRCWWTGSLILLAAFNTVSLPLHWSRFVKTPHSVGSYSHSPSSPPRRSFSSVFACSSFHRLWVPHVSKPSWLCLTHSLSTIIQTHVIWYSVVLLTASPHVHSRLEISKVFLWMFK